MPRLRPLTALIRLAFPLVALLPLTGPAQTVTRQEAVEIASAYQHLIWTPTASNVFHGVDPDGVRVDTPDRIGMSTSRHRGWWAVGQEYMGVPYMWGGFSSPEEFAEGVRAGKYAGDVYSNGKRERLEAAVSHYAVGIDCSGLVSRCWRLDRSYSTRELAALCVPLESFDELRPGDLCNINNEHAMLFKEWRDPQHVRMNVFEAGSPPTGKVVVDNISVRYLNRHSYKAYRYRNIRD